MGTQTPDGEIDWLVLTVSLRAMSPVLQVLGKLKTGTNMSTRMKCYCHSEEVSLSVAHWSRSHTGGASLLSAPQALCPLAESIREQQVKQMCGLESPGSALKKWTTEELVCN